MAIIGVLVIAGYFLVRTFLHTDAKPASTAPTSLEAAIDLRPSIIAKINEVINKGSDGLYSFTTKDMTLDVLTGTVHFLEPKLTPDLSKLPLLEEQRKAPDDVFTISLNSLTVEGIGLKDFTSKKDIDLDALEFINPTIKVYHKKRTYNQSTIKDTATLYQRIMQNMEHIGIKKLVIKNGTIINENVAKNKTTKVQNVSVDLENILIDSSTQYSKDRFLFAEKAAIQIKNYHSKTTDNLYELSTELIKISGTNNLMSISNLNLLPIGNKEDFERKVGHMQERYSIKVPSLQFKKMDWWALFNEEAFTAQEVEMSNSNIEVYLDRTKQPPTKTKIGKYPHQLLMKLPLQVNIKQLNINNAEVMYEELNPVSGKSGKLYLNNLNAHAINVTNEKDQISKNRFSKVSATALIKKTVPLSAHLSFDLKQYKSGNFTAQVKIGATDNRKIINEVAEPLGLLSIKTGSISNLSSTISGNNIQGSGKVLLAYNDLHISLLKKDETESDGLGKNPKRI